MSSTLLAFWSTVSILIIWSSLARSRGTSIRGLISLGEVQALQPIEGPAVVSQDESSWEGRPPLDNTNMTLLNYSSAPRFSTSLRTLSTSSKLTPLPKTYSVMNLVDYHNGVLCRRNIDYHELGQHHLRIGLHANGHVEVDSTKSLDWVASEPHERGSNRDKFITGLP